MEDLKMLKIKNWKKTAKERRTWRDLAEKAKTHRGLQRQMMMMVVTVSNLMQNFIPDVPEFIASKGAHLLQCIFHKKISIICSTYI